MRENNTRCFCTTSGDANYAASLVQSVIQHRIMKFPFLTSIYVLLGVTKNLHRHLQASETERNGGWLAVAKTMCQSVCRVMLFLVYRMPSYQN